MKLPQCQCGCNKWGSANGQLSARFSHCSFWCEECGREGVYIRCQKQIVLTAFITTETVRDVDQGYLEQKIFPHWETLDRRNATPTTARTDDCIAPNIPPRHIVYMTANDEDWVAVEKD